MTMTLNLLLLSATLLTTPARAQENAAGPANGQSITHLVEKPDSLWNLAKRYYHDPYSWRLIADANPWLKNPHWIYPGQKLVIPAMAGKAPAPAPAPVVAAPPPPAPVVPPTPVAAAPPAPVVTPPIPDLPPAKTAMAAAAPAPLPPMTEKLPAPDRMRGLDEELPPSLAASDVSMRRHTVPLDWKPQGAVADDDFLNAIDGQEVSVNWREDVSLLPGSLIYVVQNAGFDYDPVTNKKTGILLQKLAQIRITKVSGARKATGVIEKANDGVQPGAAVQVNAP